MDPSLESLLADDTIVALARRILTGRCYLFLGAGASIDSGAPTTQVLADHVAEHVLMTDQRGIPLDQVVEYADAYTGRPAVVSAIRQRLGNLEPSEALRSLAKLPWRAVYSVNFDDLFEIACQAERPGKLRVFSAPENLEEIRPGEIPLYMLHGSIRAANSTPGLVITREDMERSLAGRQAFYRRLSPGFRS